MSKYAKNTKVASSKTLVAQKTVNNAGGEAFKTSPELELVQLLAASKLQNQAYRTGDEAANRLSALVAKVDPLFAAKAAVYTRMKFEMRSTSHLVAAEVSQICQGKPWGKNFFSKVAFRPDDVTEITAAVIAKFGKNRITNAMRKGLGDRLAAFDEYQIAKYRGNGDFKLVDAVNLLHPPASKALTGLVKDTLKPAETWEVKRTQTGQASKAENLSEEDAVEAQAQNWRDLLDSKKLPYFAAIRNVRNILREAPDKVDALVALITNAKLISTSKLFPYHFYLAAKAVLAESGKEGRAVVQALNKAMDISCANVPDLSGETLVAIDHSGSMNTGVSFAKGKDGSKGASEVSLTAMEAADIFAAVMVKKFNCDIITFGTRAEYVSTNPSDSVITIAKSLKSDMGGTNFGPIFQTANKPYDRIIIISDNEHWIGHRAPTGDVKAYHQRFGKATTVYLWTLAGYETHPLPEGWFKPLAGFSPNVFNILKNSEVDSQALLKEIRAVEL
jgi:60 kDa SS-A/Ro ribonucleoprotein